MEVALPDGTTILAQGRLDLVASHRPRTPVYAVYLDARWADDPTVDWPCALIAWPDFGLPADEEGFFGAIADLYARARSGQLVEVACYGGIGRTGTALACAAVLAGTDAPAAIAWVRARYHPSAVETAQQEALVARFADHLRRGTGPAGPERRDER